MNAAEASFFEGNHCQHLADYDEHARIERKHRESRDVLRLRLGSPNRTTTPQHDAAHLPLFVAGNEPTLI